MKVISIPNKLIMILLLLPLLTVMKLHLFSTNVVVTYTSTWILSSIFYFVSVYFIKKNNISRKDTILFLILSVLIQISFLNFEPIGSDDIYRYMWDGKVQDAGINPYQYKPSDEKLNFLHSDILPERMNFKEMKTIYFPLSQWIFYFAYKLSNENYWGYKFFILISILISFLLIYKILEKCGLEKKYLLIFVLSPLIYFQFSVDGHLDAFGLPMLLASLYFYLNEKKVFSAIFLGLSFSIKPIGFVLLPIFFLNEKYFKDKIKFFIIPIIVFGLQFIPYFSSSNPFEAFLIYTKNWIYNGLIFNFFNAFIHNNQTARLITSGLLLIILLPIYFSKLNFLAKCYYSFLFMIIFSPVVHPWYLSWILILIPLFPNWSGIYLVSAVSFTSLTILNYKLNGVWKDYLAIQIIEYLPVIILSIIELYHLKPFSSHDKEKPKFSL